MLLQTQPNCWSCLPTAFAILLDVKVQDIFDLCGHDGSEIVFPGRSDPHGRRSFHIQEMINFCDFKQRSVTPIECNPVSVNQYGEEYSIPVDPGRIYRYLSFNIGVLVGIINGNQHAAAWCGNGFAYDPNGTIYDVDYFSIKSFFAIKSK